MELSNSAMLDGMVLCLVCVKLLLLFVDVFVSLAYEMANSKNIEVGVNLAENVHTFRNFSIF